MNRRIWNREATPIPPPVVCLVNKLPRVGIDPAISFRLLNVFQAPLDPNFWFIVGEIFATSPWLPMGGLVTLTLVAEPTIWTDTVIADSWELISIPVRNPRGTICIQGQSGTLILFDFWLRLDQLTAGMELH